MKKIAVRATVALVAWTVLSTALAFGGGRFGFGPEVAVLSASPNGGGGLVTPIGDAAGNTVPGIPDRALAAYVGAANHPTNDCGVRWADLAAIGFVESVHGAGYGPSTYSDILADGSVVKRSDHSQNGIMGPELAGRGVGGNITPFPVSAAGRKFGITGRWERALGPMQHMPKEFERNGVDADGDGKKDPFDFDDAALSSIRHLCDDKKYKPEGSARRTAIRRYNGSGPNAERYADQALQLAAKYEAAAPPNIQTLRIASISSPASVQMSGGGGLGTASSWWMGVGQSWGDYGLPATITGEWLGFLSPGTSGGAGGFGAVAVSNGSYPDGESIAKGKRQGDHCKSGFTAAADSNYCTPRPNPNGGPSAHPQMNLDIARAGKGWLDRNNKRENLGTWRPHYIVPPKHCGACATYSDHKIGNAIDWPGYAPSLDPLAEILCKHTTQSRWCRVRGISANPNGAFSVLLFTGDRGHSDHIHTSINPAATGAAVDAVIADLGGIPTELARGTAWRPRVQYGGSQPKHAALQ